VFLDETAATTKMTRTALARPRAASHWQTSILLAGLRLTGLTAPTVIDGAMTTLVRAYLPEAQLVAPGA
jgi:hypothetical protein